MRAVPGQCVDERTAPATEEGPPDGELLERFASAGDQRAFEALVRRHGPMVLQVCRRVLRNGADADDAFQATFLILARKARSVGRPELLANWLYRVAYRTALKARAGSARRQQVERRADVAPPTEPALAVAWRELLAVLDEEINALEPKHRAALVLCYLEGKTHEEAARQMRCPAGSMSWLVGKALSLLRGRLVRRGLELPAGLPALLLALCQGERVPTWLAEATLKLGALAVAGKALAGIVPASVARLADAVVRESVLGRKLRALVLALLLLIIGGGSAILAAAFLGVFDGSPAASGGCHR